MKKYFLMICCVSLTAPCFADKCPDIQHLKATSLVGWKAYDLEDNKPLSAPQLLDFKKQAGQFALAEWTNDAHQHGAMHCYYMDKDGSRLAAYLVKENLAPVSQNAYWYPVSGFMHCAAGLEKCAFDGNAAASQLAKK